MFALDLPIPTTSFVGRIEEQAKIATLLTDPNCRLLTLVGVGGIGKTRLALQAATEQAPHFRDGVAFVPLTPVRSPDWIAPAIASALQVTFHGAANPRRQIVHYLRERQILLLMDNFEHLLAGTDLLVDILRTAPGVKFLVTSRERLNVQEEWSFALDGLSVPDDGSSYPLESYSAVQLFVQRARQIQPDFSLSDQAEAVKAVCEQVEGMPLGLELSAHWLRVMSCSQIAAHMAGSLDFLTTPLRNVPERHRSLRAVFEQSWSLLSESECSALMRLSVFRGGFDLQAAEQVAGATVTLLAGLVDRSLIRLHPIERYDLHELLRQYAAEKLEAAGETRTTAGRHLRYFVNLTEQAEKHIWGREQQVWYDRLDLDMDNLRTAMAWSVQAGEAEQGLRIAAALGWFFDERSHWREGLAWLERMLTAAPDAPAALRAKALHRAGELAGHLGGRQKAQALFEQALTLARTTNDRTMIAWALASLGFFVEAGTHPERAATLLDESRALFGELADPFGLNHALRRRAIIAWLQENYPLARALHEEALHAAEEVGDRNGVAQVLYHLGILYTFADREFEQAIKTLQRAIVLFREAGNLFGVVWSLQSWGFAEYEMGHLLDAQRIVQEALVMLRDFAFDTLEVETAVLGLAIIATARGELERAARLFGTMNIGTWETSVIFVHPTSGDQLHTAMAALRASLDDTAFNDLWAAGKAMTREQAVAYALEGRNALADVPLSVPEVDRETMPSQRTSGQPQTDSLGARELEILRLVATGLSNREIAEQLVLATGTIKWYLNEINSKLGVHNRTQAVARARELGLLT